jgi:hypothetical protein
MLIDDGDKNADESSPPFQKDITRKGGGSNLQNSFLKGFCPQRVDNTG